MIDLTIPNEFSKIEAVSMLYKYMESIEQEFNSNVGIGAYAIEHITDEVGVLGFNIQYNGKQWEVLKPKLIK